MDSKQIALFFGSFNPIHNAHLMIAQRIIDERLADEVWFVVSPHNPMKEAATLATPNHRLNMVKLAIADNPKLRPSDVELSLPTPSYTINTLQILQQHFPTHQFSITMGADNLNELHKWKNADLILNNYPIIVYPRPNVEPDPHKLLNHPTIQLLNVPTSTLSSTEIRQKIKSHADPSNHIHPRVFQYIKENHLYI